MIKIEGIVEKQRKIEIDWYDKKHLKFLGLGDGPPTPPPERWEKSSTDIVRRC